MTQTNAPYEFDHADECTKAQIKKILKTYHNKKTGVLTYATESGRVFTVRETMKELAEEGFVPMGGYDIDRKLIYNWFDDNGTEAFIL